jgi:hypothetical protein
VRSFIRTSSSALLEDSATQAAVNLVAADRGELVRLQRDALQRAIEMQPVAAVERLTGRIVRTFLSGTSALGEVFVLEPAASSPVSPAAD